MSGGRREIGPKMWLYRQQEDGNALQWDYLGGFVGEGGEGGIGGLKSSWSEWSGSQHLLSLLLPLESFLADPLTLLPLRFRNQLRVRFRRSSQRVRRCYRRRLRLSDGFRLVWN